MIRDSGGQPEVPFLSAVDEKPSELVLLSDTEGRRPCDNGSRDWSAEALSRGSPAAPEAGERPEIAASPDHLFVTAALGNSYRQYEQYDLLGSSFPEGMGLL